MLLHAHKISLNSLSILLHFQMKLKKCKFLVCEGPEMKLYKISLYSGICRSIIYIYNFKYTFFYYFMEL